ncbi:thioredoxin family protein [Nitratifractor salsuginis]|uniref:thioredoxin family protein n=1 Tax=Nitratifractor salsuginis TaxID=269261 RepID=UPI00145F6F57|nr:thioredoxin family protein [Nitratifractor salsuginis]
MNRCGTCHTGYVDPELLKKNFFQKKNRLLHLKAPTVNMLVYAMLQGPKKVGDIPDREMRREEIAAYLEEVLPRLDMDETLFTRGLLQYFGKKCSIKGLDERDYLDLSDFFMEYMKHRFVAKAHSKRHLENPGKLGLLLSEAKRSGKYLIVEASSPYCHYCKRMDREVLSDPEVQKLLRKHFIMAEVNVQSTALPEQLVKVYRHITPSFFILDGNGTLLGHYPGSWTRKDFLSILREHLPSRR